MLSETSFNRVPGSDLTAAKCRDVARELFASAIAENDLAKRESYMQRGEQWMARWRFWPPDLA